MNIEDIWFFDVETKPEAESDMEKLLLDKFPSIDNYPEKLPGKFKYKLMNLSVLYNKKFEYKEASDLYRQEIKDNLALDPLTNEILCIGVIKNSSWVFLEGTEKEILTSFWDLVRISHSRREKWCGWNCYSFDLPLILKKSWKYGIEIPTEWNPLNNKFYIDYCIDLMKVFDAFVYGTMTSLDNAALFLNVGEKVKDAGISGKNFFEYYNAGGLKKEIAIRYIKEDVSLLIHIYNKIKTKAKIRI